MASLGIILGTGPNPFADWPSRTLAVNANRFGEASAPLTLINPPQTSRNAAAAQAWLLPRHGSQHQLAPHLINYRANLLALQQQGVGDIIALFAVGAIDPDLAPGQLVVPDQLIDYSWGRAHTVFDQPGQCPSHVDFTEPYTAALRAQLLRAIAASGLNCCSNGTYAAAQGPRYESRAEIARMARDGCTIVGMTGMPEAGLARELGLNYAALAVVMNPAAGIREQAFDPIAANGALQRGAGAIAQLMAAFMLND